ncbi:MAG: BamA/TamA family outer membrane protein [Candidatus Omnitrophica bacterium]|nr:BamA/TamA family outer membrane protein [Candidatus Omnitrophota bacterium]MBU1997798.1 BamA/TamA family outer membrane protein [Candidatus Omnitrophota bacterium]
MKNKKLMLALCCMCFIATKAFSQVIPERVKAGVVERGIEQREIQRALEKDTLPLIEMEPLPEQMNLSGEKKIAVNKFLFEGNTIFSSKYLLQLLADYRGESVSLQMLKNACQEITNAYKKKGFFLARAYLPEQEIKDGVFRIEIIEGNLGTVSVEGSQHYTQEFIRSHFSAGPKNIVNYDYLLKSLLILNEYRDLNVKAQFQKGSQPYTVDVVLKVQDKMPLHALTDYNNFGSKYVSRHRAGVMAEYTNFLIDGGKFSARAVTGFPVNNLFFGKTAYTVPVNRFGTKAEVSYMYSDFNVQKEYRELDAGGISKVYGLGFTHPITRTRVTSADVNMGFDYKTIRDYLIGDISSRDDLRIFKLGLDYNHTDSYNGRNYFSFLSSCGVADILDGSPHDNPLASRSGAGGDFIKSNFEFARFQQLKWGAYIVLRSSLQVASDVLPVSEQFSIGGPDSVRGFSQSEYLGDSGHLLSLELRFSPPFLAEKNIPFTNKKTKEHLQLVAFMDYGKAFLRNPMADESKDYEISGAGIGARVKFTPDFSLRVDLGYPVSGKNESNDSDPIVYIQSINKF